MLKVVKSNRMSDIEFHLWNQVKEKGTNKLYTFSY